MQIYTILTTLFLASTALACANGPYPVGSACGGDCAGAQRCSKNNNNVVCPSVSSPNPRPAFDLELWLSSLVDDIPSISYVSCN